MITQERLKQLLNYDKSTGSFMFVDSGKKAGYIANVGYKVVCLDKKIYYLHRLAWLYVHGYTPENCIDHINRNKLDNSISNLREASRQCNFVNTGLSKANSTMIKGVSFITAKNKYIAQISVSGKKTVGGHYNSKLDAACARHALEQCAGWDVCHPDSTAKLYIMSCGIKIL